MHFIRQPFSSLLKLTAAVETMNLLWKTLIAQFQQIQTTPNIIDGLSRELLLLVQTRQYDRALEIFNSRSFPQFEGVDRVYISYLNAMLLRGYKNLNEGINLKQEDR
jgi:hypothetical protein